MKTNFSFKDLCNCLREGAYTSPGCYPKFYIAADGEALSHDSVIENLLQIGRAMRDDNDKQWQVIGCEINYEYPNLYCSHSSKPIPSAYGVSPRSDL